MQCELIKWLAYPENIPVIEKIYDLTYKSLGVLMVGEDSWLGDRWRYCDDDKVIAYSEKAKPYNPEAKQFNFWTALELMKSGVVCKSLATNNVFTILVGNNYFSIKNIYNDKMISWTSECVSLPEIEGLWEVANAD